MSIRFERVVGSCGIPLIVVCEILQARKGERENARNQGGIPLASCHVKPFVVSPRK
jgi:hypothetical protein